MQREISDSVRQRINCRAASNFGDTKDKAKKIRELISTSCYDENLAKYILGMLELAFQGMLEGTDTKEKSVRPSYVDKEQLDFQILLTENYYVNPNGIHICFPIKIKKTKEMLLAILITT